MSRVHSVLSSVTVALLFSSASLPAAADEEALTLLQCGDEEREDAGGTCLQETEFLAGTTSTAQHLKVGGEALGCDSEWATSVEFDLTAIPAGLQVFSATLIVRKTGYSDDSQGFFYLGVFPYAATGAPVPVPRSALTPETALDIVYPTAANVDLSLNVTEAVAQWVADGESRAGFLLAGVFSEVGYEDWISVGGAEYTFPPRLLVSHEVPIGVEVTPWTVVKSRYR